jgi:DNA-binding XRE family transcriptional regulator
MAENNNTGKTDHWKHEMGCRLRELRKHYGCKQGEMAEKMRLNINTYRTNESFYSARCQLRAMNCWCGQRSRPLVPSLSSTSIPFIS